MTPIVSTTLLRTQSDGRLAELAAGGSERAFEAIVERYRRALSRYCRRLVGESRADDVVQEVFVKAWDGLRTGPSVSELRPWLYRIAHNTSLNALRKKGYDYVELQESLRGSHAEPEVEQERRAVVLRTLAGVAALPEAQRAALMRTAVDGISHEEVAQELGLSEPAVRGLVYRARETLRTVATALTPSPLINWLVGVGRSGGGTPRIAELVAGGGGAAGAGLMVKAGAILGAGAIATGAVTLKPLSPRESASAADVRATGPSTAPTRAFGGDGSGDSYTLGDEHRGRGERSGRARGDDDSSGPRSGGEDNAGSHNSSGSSGSSGAGSGDDTLASGATGWEGSTSGPSGSSTQASGSGGSGSDDATSGSSGSGSSGSGSSGSGDLTSTTSGSSGSGSGTSDTSGSGTSGSGTSGTSGSGTSGTSGSGTSGTSGSDTSGSGTSGSGTSGSDTSGSGTSGSGSSGSGSDDSRTSLR